MGIFEYITHPLYGELLWILVILILIYIKLHTTVKKE